MFKHFWFSWPRQESNSYYAFIFCSAYAGNSLDRFIIENKENYLNGQMTEFLLHFITCLEWVVVHILSSKWVPLILDLKNIWQRCSKRKAGLYNQVQEFQWWKEQAATASVLTSNFPFMMCTSRRGIINSRILKRGLGPRLSH